MTAEGGGRWRRVTGARGGIAGGVAAEVEVAEAGDDERDAAARARATVSSDRGSEADLCRLMLIVTVAPGLREAAAGGAARGEGGICYGRRDERWGDKV